jgi:cyclophilin family peptidyl-prolyl cis-trans isomerase
MAALFLGSALAACPARPAPLPDSGDAAEDSQKGGEFAAIARAEDERRASGISEAMQTSQDVRVRRAAARALSRIADSAAGGGLFKALTDEDPETVGWGAYGLGFGCKGNEDAHVRALAARAVSFDGPSVQAREGDATVRHVVDPRMAIARAIGRCGNTLAEQVLVAWIRTSGPMSVPAAYGLGDIARSRGALDDSAVGALLDAAQSRSAGAPPSLPYLYPFGRLDPIPEAWAPRVLEIARRALTSPSPVRSFAIRALARCGRGAAEDLERVAENRDAFTASERAEAARGLSLLGESGRSAAGAAIGRLAPDRDPYAILALGGDEYAVFLALLQSLGGEAPKDGLAGLRVLAALSAPGNVPPALARRIAELRCTAAAALANGAYEADVLSKCDGAESEAKDRARLATLLRRPLVGDRRAAWLAFVRSPRLRLREAALESIAGHAELGDAARVALAEALESEAPGVVAVATGILQAHPDRVMVLSAREIRSAIDPSAPPPTTNPSREVDHAVAMALLAAILRAWSPDLIETRVGLLDAVSALRLAPAHQEALKACHDPNATVRDHAQRDLRELGDTSAACSLPAVAPDAAKDADSGLVRDLEGTVDPRPDAGDAAGVRVTFETDAGELAIVFEPGLAPVAALRFVTLARQGFYRGLVFHRVVPGFVVQFGDPGGDGFGGSGSLLRCETSPVPFEALDVGVALSGRDTGSSQLFVTLGRYPHLDGEFARVGRARGDWAAVAEGDVIREVKVED